MIEDAGLAARRALDMVDTRYVTSLSGKPIPVTPDTLCLHGDQPGAVPCSLARALVLGMSHACFTFDSGMGSGLSILVTFVSFWLIGSLLIQGPSQPLAKALQKSETLGFMNDVMPPPPNVLRCVCIQRL